MEVMRSKNALRQLTSREGRGSVVAIGTFDGVHLGHQEILRRVLEKARELDAVSLVFAFEPTPKEFFATAQPPARLTRFRERVAVLRSLGIERFFCPRFDAEFQKIGVEEFVEDVLLGSIRARAVVLGEDFRFGYGRSGGIDDLQSASRRHGFELLQVPDIFVAGERVSSSRIREALLQADFDLAARLLGRRYMMSGRVAQGRRLGRQLGFPTANISTGRRNSAVNGVYAVLVHGLVDSPLPGVANVGTRPTVHGGGKQVLETHLFDFDRDIYGRLLHIEFVSRIRSEMRFQNVAELAAQIGRDCAEARRILGC
jgi:riboflavin kinase/FMN adenylyltransferase